MEQNLYRRRLETHGLRVNVPEAASRADVHRIIYDELCHGVIREQSRARYEQVVAELVDSGAEGVILGCTEIEMLLDPDDSPMAVPLFPTARIHALAAVDAALG